MKIRQFHGPFRSGEEICRLPAELNTNYVQIGVLIPECETIVTKKALRPDININGQDFCVHNYWMIEFADITVSSFIVTARRNLPAECIVDILTDVKRE